MQRLTVSGFLCAALLACTLQAHALEGDTMDRWMTSMAEMKHWSDQQPDRNMAEADEAFEVFEFERGFNEVISRYPELRQIVRRHGFSDGADWARVGGRVFSAYVSLKMGDASPEMDAQMAAMMREMESNPDIPAEYREMMRQQMQQQMQVMAGFPRDVPEKDMQVVRARESDLDQLFAEMDDDDD